MRVTDIHKRFRVVPDFYSREKRAGITEFKAAFPFSPTDYVELVETFGGFHLKIENGKGGWLILSWHSFEDSLAFVSDYPFVKELGQVFFFATDGDVSYFYSVESGYKVGIYKVETSAAFWSEVEFVASDFRAMLTDGVGIFSRIDQ